MYPVSHSNYRHNPCGITGGSVFLSRAQRWCFRNVDKQPPNRQLSFSLDLILLMGNLGINLTTNPGLDYNPLLALLLGNILSRAVFDPSELLTCTEAQTVTWNILWEWKTDFFLSAFFPSFYEWHRHFSADTSQPFNPFFSQAKKIPYWIFDTVNARFLFSCHLIFAPSFDQLLSLFSRMK